MSEPVVIHVKPRVMGNKVKTEWGVYIGDSGEPIVTSKLHCDCDMFAEKLAKMCENVVVDHHPERLDNTYKNGD